MESHLFQADTVEAIGCMLISSIASWNFMPGTTSNKTYGKWKYKHIKNTRNTRQHTHAKCWLQSNHHKQKLLKLKADRTKEEEQMKCTNCWLSWFLVCFTKNKHLRTLQNWFYKPTLSVELKILVRQMPLGPKTAVNC